jgi:hypothetical protein
VRSSLRALASGFLFLAVWFLCFLILALLWLALVFADASRSGRQIVECDSQKCSPLAELSNGHPALLVIAGTVVAFAACAGIFWAVGRRA